MAELIRLRDLPGVQGITDLCRNPRNFDYPQSSYTAEKIAAVSIGLFGITQWDTEWEAPAQTFPWAEAEDGFEAFEHYEAEQAAFREEAKEYEAQFHPTRVAWPEIEPFWQALGWDISDGDGGELISAHCFARQIIAIARDLVDGAKLTLDGSGEWSVPGGDEIDEETLEQRLKREADAFMAGRGR